MAAPPFRLVVVGHVDHGKSSLLGRLLADTGSLPEGRLEAIRAMSERRGMAFEWAFALDAFQAERDQAITIDATHVWFRSPGRRYVVVDAPGHREFIKNMVSGASSADAALLVVDASEGVREQSRRHGYLLSLIGVRQVVVALNKMDLVGYDEARYRAVADEIGAYLSRLGLVVCQVVPTSARGGDNLIEPSDAMGWYVGPTLLGALDALNPPHAIADAPLRLPIQDVYHFDQRRILAGRIESGRLKLGDTLLFSPSNKTARVTGIEAWPAGPRERAEAGQSIGIQLDEQLFIERGELASHVEHAPVETNVFRARLFWLGRTPLRPGRRYKLRLATRESAVEVQSVERLIDIDVLEAAPPASAADAAVERNGIAEVVLRSPAMLALDTYDRLPRTGRFVLVDGDDIAGGGQIGMEGYPDQRTLITARSSNIQAVGHRIGRDERTARNAHKGGVVWLTGLSGAGKSTIAIEVEAELFRRGYQAYVLDGDNVRAGLNANLGFAPEDRAENIRRVGEVAALFADAGILVISAFISPYRADRERARAAAERIEPGAFHEVHISAPLDVCEQRDPKGLYRKARAGEIKEFTGISAPYEPPDKPELVIHTDEQSVVASVAALVAHIEKHFGLR
ncbi:MAG: adenylyl-sulfate kinase [Alphaproteobacteria bacterium]